MLLDHRALAPVKAQDLGTKNPISWLLSISGLHRVSVPAAWAAGMSGWSHGSAVSHQITCS